MFHSYSVNEDMVPEVVDLFIFLCNLALYLSPYLLQLHLKLQCLTLLVLQSALVGRYSGLVNSSSG